jgi:hypothetical protein
LASSGLLAAKHVLLGGGAGTAPTSDSALDDGATTANTLTYTGSGGFALTGGPLAVGSSPPTVTGTGIIGLGETTGQACASGADCIIANSSAHQALLSNNNATAVPIAVTPAATTANNIPVYSGTAGSVLGTGITPGTGVATALAAGVSGSGAICLASGSACGSGSSPAFSALTSATNTTAAMLVGTGASLGPTGSGTVSANQINGTATSGLATGILKNTTSTGVPSIAVSGTDYAAPCTTTATTGASATLSTCFTVNQEATAGTAITYTLPTAASGLQYCIDNGNGGSANTGTLELLTSASGQFIVFTDGTLSATGGYVISGGAARDGACVYGIDSTHWMFLPHAGSWAKH